MANTSIHDINCRKLVFLIEKFEVLIYLKLWFQLPPIKKIWSLKFSTRIYWTLLSSRSSSTILSLRLHSLEKTIKRYNNMLSQVQHSQTNFSLNTIYHSAYNCTMFVKLIRAWNYGPDINFLQIFHSYNLSTALFSLQATNFFTHLGVVL